MFKGPEKRSCGHKGWNQPQECVAFNPFCWVLFIGPMISRQLLAGCIFQAFYSVLLPIPYLFPVWSLLWQDYHRIPFMLLVLQGFSSVYLSVCLYLKPKGSYLHSEPMFKCMSISTLLYLCPFELPMHQTQPPHSLSQAPYGQRNLEIQFFLMDHVEHHVHYKSIYCFLAYNENMKTEAGLHIHISHCF